MEDKKHPGGRPVKEHQQKNCRSILFEVNESEWNTFIEEFQKSKEHYKKAFFFKAIKKYNMDTTASIDSCGVQESLMALKTEIEKIGTNINQVAHKVNLFGFDSSSAEIAEKIDELKVLMETANKVIGKINSTCNYLNKTL